MKFPIAQNRIQFRPLNAASDSFDEITLLLHRAYKRLLEMGLRYVATSQSVARTRQRCLADECYVATTGKSIVGVICFEKSESADGTRWYNRPEVAYFSQFGVEPDLQGKGVGRLLLDVVEARAYETGAYEIALDTAIPAKHLISFYRKHGYRVVDEHQWQGANYKSCIMSKSLIEKPALAEQRPRIAIFGTLCADHVHRIHELPTIGHYAEIDSEHIQLGGEGANTAAWISGFGFDHHFYGNAIGQDADAKLIQKRLRSLIINSSFPTTLGATPRCEVYVDSFGRRTMFGHGFASLSRKHFESKIELRKDDWLTVDPNCPEAARAVTKTAMKIGANIYAMDVLDSDWLDELSATKARLVLQTSTDLVGEFKSIRAALGKVKAWSTRFRCDAIITDAANGVYFCPYGEHPRHIAALKVEKFCDATGAGDVFRAAMLCQLVSGSELSTAINFAQAAAALKCGHWGATTSRYSVGEVWEFLASGQDSRS